MQCCGRSGDPCGWEMASAAQASDEEGCRPRGVDEAWAPLRSDDPCAEVGTRPPAQVGLRRRHAGIADRASSNGSAAAPIAGSAPRAHT